MALLLPRRPEHGNVLDIPTPPLQQVALFIIFFFTALAFLVYSLRVYTRLKTRQWGLDDWMVTGAMVFSLMMIAPFYMYIKLNYFGWRAVDVPEFDPSPGMWWFYLAQLFYNPILALVKASVLCFLLRLGGQKPGVKYVIYGLNTFNALQAIAIFLVAMLQCLPISANWDMEVRADPSTRCVDNSFHIIISSITIFTDICVVGLPFWIFLGLKMPVGAKVAVVGIFMLGLAVTIISIVRLTNVYKLFYAQDPTADPYHDIGITLNVVEANIAIVSASAPALRPLFRSLFPSLFGGSSARYGLGKYNPNSGAPYYVSGMGTAAGTGTRSGTKNGLSSVIGGGDDGDGDDGKVSVNRHGGSIRLKALRNGGSGMTGSKSRHTECRSISPTGSEEEIMTYNGIMRTTDVRVQVHFENGDAERESRASSDLKGSRGEVEKSGL